MCFRKNFLVYTLICLSLSIGLNTSLAAQPNHDFDDLPLNGLAAFAQLRQEYYIAGLYLESLNQDSGAVFNFAGRKRMELRITIDKWSPRRFGQQWDQAILINNDQAALEQYADQILAFTDLPKDDLVAGDRITIDMDPSLGTTVYINNQRMFHIKDNAFFDLLLNTWIGQRPPSSDFKNDILTLPTDQAGTDLLVRYEAIKPDAGRAEKVARWAVDIKDDDSHSVAAGLPAAVSVAPPGSGTTVTAKRSKTEDTRVAEDFASTAPTAPIAAPKPLLEMEKPQLATTHIEQPKTVAAAPVKAAPKPPQKKPAASQETSDSKEQDSLEQAYRSNVLKLTFLNTQYPKRAMDFKQEGLVVLKVTINRKGDVKEVVETTSSEHSMLNKAARQAVQKTEPYPEFPKALKLDTVEVTLPFNFRL